MLFERFLIAVGFVESKIESDRVFVWICFGGEMALFWTMLRGLIELRKQS